MAETIAVDLSQIKVESGFFRALELLGLNHDGDVLTKVDPKAIYEIVIEDGSIKKVELQK